VYGSGSLGQPDIFAYATTARIKDYVTFPVSGEKKVASLSGTLFSSLRVLKQHGSANFYSKCFAWLIKKHFLNIVFGFSTTHRCFS
jgi:hypothetical protein